MLQPRACEHKHIPKKQKLAFGFYCYIMYHPSRSLASLLEVIQCGLKGLKYFAWDVTVSVFFIKSLPSIGWDLQNGFSAETNSTYSTDSSFSAYITHRSDCVNLKMLLRAQSTGQFLWCYFWILWRHNLDFSSQAIRDLSWSSHMVAVEGCNLGYRWVLSVCSTI